MSQTDSGDALPEHQVSDFRVEYFGPDTTEAGAGGIASVIALLVNHDIAGRTRHATATMMRNRPLFSVDLFLRAVGRLLRLRLRGQPMVAHVHVSDGGSLYREGGILWLASLLGLPTVMTLHACSLEEVVTRQARPLRKLLAAADITQVLGTDSEEILAPFLPTTATGDERDHRVVKIANGVTIPRAVADAGEQDCRVFFGGEVGTRKGVDVLLAAWPQVRVRYPDAMLRIAGPVTDIGTPSGPGIHYLGELHHDQMATEFRSARLGVLPSRQEALPMFIIEAMAQGRPVISTPVGEISSVLSPEQLVEVGDEDALAERMVALLEPAAATRVGHRNRDVAQTRLSSAAMCERIDQLYRSVIATSN